MPLEMQIWHEDSRNPDELLAISVLFKSATAPDFANGFTQVTDRVALFGANKSPTAVFENGRRGFICTEKPNPSYGGHD